MHLLSRVSLSLFAFAVLPAFGLAEEKKEEFPLVSAEECRVRGGLPNFFKKLAGEGEIRIGYLGGSITAAPGWRVKSLQSLQAAHPNVTLQEINAAIGGTGSDLGVFRVGRDVLEKRPDLLFIEFAVNDAGADPAAIQRQMEGIVRQTWKADPTTDICFVYTISEPLRKDLEEGKFPRAASAMEAVADHYGIPSVHFGVEITRQVKEGKMIFQASDAEVKSGELKVPVFSTDGVHPLVETGQQVYADTLERALKLMKEEGTAPVGAHAPGAPLRSDNWENARLIPVSESMLKGEWSRLNPDEEGLGRIFRDRMPEMWRTTAAGASLEFTVTGNVVEIYDLVGPDGGTLQVQVDDTEPREVNRIDGYCTYHRLAKTPVLFANAPGKHRVKITLSGKAPDKEAILFEANREYFRSNPDKYSQNAWTIGGILIVGEVRP